MAKNYILNIKNKEGEWQEVPVIVGPKGTKGENGKSAYEIWLETNPSKTKEEFLKSLIGPKGERGIDGRQGVDGRQGIDGKSAYQIWLDEGNTGTKTDFINSLKVIGPQGIQGIQGPKGADGKSAYQSWKEKTTDTDKSEEAFTKYLKGDDVFTVWKKETGNLNATFEEYKNDIKGPKGDKVTNDEIISLITDVWNNNFVYLTLEEYNNLQTKDPNKIYVIIRG